MNDSSASPDPNLIPSTPSSTGRRPRLGDGRARTCVLAAVVAAAMAVDVGPTDAAYWFRQHGADHGLCETKANDIWHYER